METRDTVGSGTESAEAMFRRARDAMFEMFRFPESGGDPARLVMDRFVESQRQATELFGAFAESWRDLAEKGAGPEAWKNHFDQWAAGMEKFEAPFDPSEALKTWKQSLSEMPDWSTYANPWAKAEGGLFDWLSSPGFGMGRAYQAKMGALFEAWLDQQTKEAEYRQVLAKTWSEAFRTLSERMGERLSEADPVTTPRELMDLWVKLADERFTEVFHTETFSQLQSSMLNAAHRVRALRKDLAQGWLKAHDMPTGQDLDEAHRTIYALRKQLRSLEREVAEMKAKMEGGA